MSTSGSPTPPRPHRIRGWLMALLAAALLASLVLNAWLAVQARQYYLELNQTRLDPLGLNAYPGGSRGPGTPEPGVSPGTVVFFGDSRAAQWPAPELAGFTFANRGIGAQTSAQALQRFDY